jgi:hypothetical protein
MSERKIGFVSHWSDSASGGYGFIKSDGKYFFHRSQILSENAPSIGDVVRFTPLPFRRATEVEIVKEAD